MIQNSARGWFFDELSQAAPRSVHEYCQSAGAAVGKISELYGIVRAECSIRLPSRMPPDEEIPEKATVFCAEGEEGAAPCLFPYGFEADGQILFSVFLKKDKSLSEDERWELGILFRQLYYILYGLLLNHSCKRLIMTDFGTGIANAEAFFRFGGRLFAQRKTKSYTAFYFNIRNFKSVNKSLSYLEGNEVMTRYCRLIADAVTKREIVAKLGGDNFVALILNENRDYFLDLVQNIIVKYEKDGKTMTFPLGASIGAVELTDETDMGDIMLRISLAYQSARDRGIALSYYDKGIGVAIMERKQILSNFSGALNRREFIAVYQPKVDVKTRTIRGAEALVRWKRDDGFVVPGKFIPVLEKDGCITSLDFYMLEEVCKFLNKLRDRGTELVKISVNFSKRHLANNRLVEEIVDVIDRYRIPHEYIQVELTESEDYNDQSVIKKIVNDLNLNGIKTALDDFGTGYSSLGMLKALQIDELKIDRSLIPVDDIGEDDKDLLMLKGVVNLANNLGLSIVAEGVETQTQLKLIESMECDIVQGYIFDKPLFEDEFIERIERKYYVLEQE